LLRHPLVLFLAGLGMLSLTAAAMIYGWRIGPGSQQPGTFNPRAAPTATAPATTAPNSERQAATVERPSFDVVRVSADGKAVLAGRAPLNSTVTVKDGDKVLGELPADRRGEWVLLPERPLDPGTRQLSLVARRADGSTILSDGHVVVVVPARDETKPESEREPAIAVLLPQDGRTGSRLLQAPPAKGDASAAKGLAIDTIDHDGQGNVMLSGRAAPNALLRGYADNKEIAVGQADSQGAWSMRPKAPLAEGRVILRVDQLAPGGEVNARIEVPFSRALPGQQFVLEGQIVVQPGNSLWRIARAVYGQGTTYTFIYQANRDQIRDPDLIYPGQIFALPKSR